MGLNYHKIIGIPDDNDVIACHFLAPGFYPEIENVMQVHVSEQVQWFRHAESKKSRVCPVESTARYRHLSWPFTFMYVSSKR
jgi:hypothetical protein